MLLTSNDPGGLASGASSSRAMCGPDGRDVVGAAAVAVAAGACTGAGAGGGGFSSMYSTS